MSRAFLLSHGDRVASKADTFVPAGRTLAFYAEFDQNTLRANGLAALNHGDIKPTETITGPAPVPNYSLSAFEDRAVAQHLAVQSSATGGRSYFVGSDLPDPSWLCTTPDACQATYPRHAAGCQGVFNRIAETEIYSVACRSLTDAMAAPTTRKLAGSEALDQENKAEAQRILTLAQTKPDEAMAYWQSLPQATRAMLGSSWVPLRTFTEQYFAGGGAATPEAVLDARRYLEAYGDATFYSWVAQLPEDGRQRTLILGDPDLAAAYQRGAEVDSRGALLDGATPAAADPLAVLGARLDAQAIVIATAVAQFAGNEYDDVAGVAEAYTALMSDVQEYQHSAGDAHQEAAESLYAAGADVGTMLALHGEQHDAESLAELAAAVDLLCQWAKSLTTT